MPCDSAKIFTLAPFSSVVRTAGLEMQGAAKRTWAFNAWRLLARTSSACAACADWCTHRPAVKDTDQQRSVRLSMTCLYIRKQPRLWLHLHSSRGVRRHQSRVATNHELVHSHAKPVGCRESDKVYVNIRLQADRSAAGRLHCKSSPLQVVTW